MRKWIYVLCPLIMLGVFIFIYTIKSQEVEAREEARNALIAKQKAEEAENRRIIEEKARLDAQKRADDRAAEAKKKEDDKVAKYAAEMKKIQDDTEKATAEAAALTDKVNELQTKLDALEKAKEQANRDAFETAKQVELAEVAYGNAEMENQREVEMIGDRADKSSLTKLPPAGPAADSGN